MTEILTAALIICFFALMIGVGIYCRKHATNVDGFVLGGRKDTQDSLAGTSVLPQPG